MRFEVLGPVRVIHDGTVKRVSDMRRRLLAALLVRANRAVDRDLLADVLWGDELPDRPWKSLQLHIHRLRQVLDDPERLAAVPVGYSLRVDAGELDAAEFATWQERARTSRDAGDLDAAVAAWRSGLALWQGAPYADVDDAHVVAPEARRLAESRLLAAEELYEAELARGRARDIVPELTEWVAEFPLRESLVGHLMVALYRSGRRTRALTAYRAARRRLRDQLDTEPGPGLRRIHDAIAADDTSVVGDPTPTHTVSGARAEAVTPAQLPPPHGTFVGRDSELDRLKALAAHADGPVSVVITGMAGVGKTGLALTYAHAVSDRYVDGRLYVDLRGHAAGPSVGPIEALGQLARGLGADLGHVADSVEASSAEFRSLTADRRVLILLDNAESAEQVRPLLPSSPTSLTIITSRHRLSGLVATDGAARIGLDVLPPDDAGALVTRLLGGERLTAEPDGAAALVEACAGLPLALRIAAAQLADEPHRRIADYLADLRTRGLATLALDDDSAAVARAFDLSYERLDATARRVFRLLGLVPADDVTVPAIAALTDMTEVAALAVVRQLTRAHLLHEHIAGRYRLHDLLRGYARERVMADEPVGAREAALHRLCTWYFLGKESAVEQLWTSARTGPMPDVAAGVQGAAMDDVREAAAWLGAEYDAIRATAHAVQRQPGMRAWAAHLLLGTAVPVARRGYSAEARSMVDAVTEIARSTGDRQMMAHALTETGAVRVLLGDVVPDDLIEEALDLAAAVGDRAIEGYCLYMAGVVRQRQARFAEAAAFQSRALDVFGAIDDAGGLSLSLNYLGGLAMVQGDLREAIRCWERILELPLNRAATSALINLTMWKPARGDLEGIEELFERAAAVVAENGDPASDGVFGLSRGKWYLGRGRVDEAMAHLVAAMKTADDLGIPRFQSDIGAELGLCHLARGDVDAAAAHLERALALGVSAGLGGEVCYATYGLAAVHIARGELTEARARARQAIDLAGDTYRLHLGNGRVALASVELAAGQYEAARRHASDAVEVHRRTEFVPGLARAYAVLGEAGIAGGGGPEDTRMGIDHLRTAIGLYERIRSPKAARLRRMVDSASESGAPSGSTMVTTD